MSRSKAFGTAIGAIALIGIFIALGLWQLDRAAKFKELQRPYKDQPIIALSEVAQPATNLTDSAINRIVKFSGTYATQFTSPNQIDNSGKTSTWLVGLMEVDGGGAILVVRSSQNDEMPRGEVSVEGRILPRQFEDRSSKADGELSRIDPALVSSLYPDALYDGFVVARREMIGGRELQVQRVNLDPARPTVPGFYWQHIAYVVIWWLMALVVLFLPFYSRWRRRQ
ncbi:MAG: SURF1 family protein [Actinomycetales bacterium]|nr:SURF1 family protein [Actinomycetales bacterium]